MFAGALPVRLRVRVRPGGDEDDWLVHVHVRHLLHSQALP